MYKLQTSLNGGVHSTENNACLFSICVPDLPGQREDVSRVVVIGVTFRPKGEGLFLSPALGFRHHGVVMPFRVNTVKGIQPCWIGCCQETQLFGPAGQGAFLTPACASGGAAPNDLTGKSCGHSLRTWMASLPCVCGNASSVHRNARTSRCSLPRYTCRASPLYASFGEPSGESFLCTLCCIPQNHICGYAVSWSLEIQTVSGVLCSQY